MNCREHPYDHPACDEEAGGGDCARTFYHLSQAPRFTAHHTTQHDSPGGSTPPTSNQCPAARAGARAPGSEGWPPPGSVRARRSNVLLLLGGEPVSSSAWEQRGAQGRQLEVGAAGEEEAGQPNCRRGLHGEQADVHDGVAEVRREHLYEEEESRVCGEVHGPRELEALEEGTQLEPPPTPQCLQPSHEPRVQEKPECREQPADGALMFVVLAGSVAPEPVKGHQHDMEDHHRSCGWPQRTRPSRVGAGQGVAVPDQDEERRTDCLAQHEGHLGEICGAGRADPVALVHPEVQSLEGQSRPLQHTRCREGVDHGVYRAHALPDAPAPRRKLQQESGEGAPRQPADRGHVPLLDAELRAIELIRTYLEVNAKVATVKPLAATT
eukprot:CAMPEP_0179330568 /NCGR_PEP_ID=MMETSP0797-20121207/63733_1 /TAXON_ID=47934 /ORGANISM="Dinophysis acuminata, Strain DAEP01" /LENGTH=381 /DNA_ID=CAMNT_0021043305 /DNA_START=174 /DNA_END=1319 /DNA_ORIENTATION=+